MLFQISILGSRGDVFVDFFFILLLIVAVFTGISFVKVRGEKYVAHRNLQLTNVVLLSFLNLLFAVDLGVHGGILKVIGLDYFENSMLMNVVIILYFIFAAIASIIGSVISVVSLVRFDRPPKPSIYSKQHKMWGRVAMVCFGLTSVLGSLIYLLGFYL